MKLNLNELLTALGIHHQAQKLDINIMASVAADIEIVVSDAASPLVVDASGVPTTATVGTPYNGTLKASGGVPPYTVALTSGALPDGLALTTDGPDAGIISGTPTTAEDSNFELTVTDSADAPASKTVKAKLSNRR